MYFSANTVVIPDPCHTSLGSSHSGIRETPFLALRIYPLSKKAGVKPMTEVVLCNAADAPDGSWKVGKILKSLSETLSEIPVFSHVSKTTH